MRTPGLLSLPGRISRRIRRASLMRRPFYRRHPFRAPLSIFEVDRRVFVSSQLRMLFNGIGKAGHSSVVVSLAQAVQNSPVRVEQAKTGSFKKPSELDQNEVASLQDYFKFTFVRNPFSRTLSAYLDKVVRQKVVPAPLQRFSPGAGPSFLDFCCYLEQEGLNDAVHWAPQVSMLVIPVGQLNLIGKLENFDHDIGLVLQKCGLGTASSAVRHDPHRTEADKRIEQFYCARTRDIIERLMKEDFLTFGYSMPMPPVMQGVSGPDERPQAS